MQAFDIAPRKRTKSVLGLPRPPRRCTPHSVFAQPALSGFYLLIDRSRWATINSAVRRPRPSRSVRSVLQLKTWPALKKELIATPQRHAAAARVGKQRRGLGPLSAVMAERRTEPLLAVAAVKSLERQIGARRGAINGRRLVQERADSAEMRAIDVPRGRKRDTGTCVSLVMVPSRCAPKKCRSATASAPRRCCSLAVFVPAEGGAHVAGDLNGLTRTALDSERPPRDRPLPCASICKRFVLRDADDASITESRRYLGARALDTREKDTRAKAGHARSRWCLVDADQMFRFRALALRNHDSGAGANTHVDDNSSASVKVQPQMASYTTDVVHQREGFVQLR